MLEVLEIAKAYGHVRALDGVTLDVAAGEVVALLGPSGCGKSTLLQIIAGLTTPDAGDVRWRGVTLAGVPPHRRGFGMMFQDYALFPHRNVFDNVAFGLKMQRADRSETRRCVFELLRRVGLAGYEQRDVGTLSGGEQQRVALARALAPEPQLLMLDEPLGSLDRNLREQLLDDLREILARQRIPVVYVTHDQDEAFAIAGRVAVMRAGRVEQVGPPQRVFEHPASEFVARFLGMENVLSGEFEQRDGRAGVHLPFGWQPLGDGFGTEPLGSPVRVLIRPTGVEFADGDGFDIAGTVVSAVFRGVRYEVQVRTEAGTSLKFELPARGPLPAVGERVRMALRPDAIVSLPDHSR